MRSRIEFIVFLLLLPFVLAWGKWECGDVSEKELTFK